MGMDGLDELSYDDDFIKSRRKKRFKLFFISSLGVFLAALILFVIYNLWLNRTYSNYDVINNIKLNGGSDMKYLAYDGFVLQYSRDGVSAIDAKGKTVWNGSYEMNRPSVDICGKSVVVADIGGKEMYVYNGEGTGKEWKVDSPIVQACISENGVLAVLLEDSTSNVINLYNPFAVSETLLAQIPTNVDEGYPVCIDISPDGINIVASYVGVSTGKVESRVAFYNFSEVGKNTNFLVGAQNYEGQIVSEVRYLDKDTVALFGEIQISVWVNMKKPETKFKIDFKEKDFKSVFCSDKYIGMIEETDEKSHPYNIILYNIEGKKVLDRAIPDEYSDVSINGDEIMLHSYSQCVIYRVNGVCKFSSLIDGKVNYFFPADKHNRYYFLTDSELREIKLKK